MADIYFKPKFRNKDAKKYFDIMSSRLHCYEAGLGTDGKIYFAFLNGNVERYSRKEFIKKAKEYMFVQENGDFPDCYCR